MVLPLSAPPLSLSHTAIGLFGLAGVAGALAARRARSVPPPRPRFMHTGAGPQSVGWAG